MPPSLDDHLRRFETAWQQGERPDIVPFWKSVVAGVPIPDRLAWLREFIKVDLEYRWSKTDGAGGWLEDYGVRFPEFGSSSDWPADLISEEWRARWRRGDRPRLEEYLRRFPGRKDLEIELNEVLEELRREAEPPVPPFTKPVGSTNRDPRAPLDYRDFSLLKLVGSGGMGKVYRARQKSLDRLVAVKMLRKSRWTLPGAVERFIEEARVVAQFRHPGIVGIHGVGQTPGGGVFIVMEFIEGSNLAEATANQRPSPRQAAEWIAEAATALDYAHQQGFVHCDLKPSNLLRETSGRIVVSDFGLATSLTALPGVRSWGGTLGFMAPEQLDATFGEIGPATDIFALGLVLHQLLTGRNPFQGKRILDVLRNWLAGNNEREITIDENLPIELGSVIARCIAIDPAARIQSGAELAQMLRSSFAVPTATD